MTDEHGQWYKNIFDEWCLYSRVSASLAFETWVNELMKQVVFV